MIRPLLELQLSVEEGREVDAARYLASRLTGPHWEILAKLAAELVFEHERVRAGARVILVASGDQAGRLLADLGRKSPEDPALPGLPAALRSP